MRKIYKKIRGNECQAGSRYDIQQRVESITGAPFLFFRRIKMTGTVKKQKKHKWMLFVLIVLAAAAVTVFFGYSRGSKASAAEISFTNMELTDTGFTAEAEFISSGKTFRTYHYTIEGSVLYLTVYGGLAGGGYSDGNFTVDIQEDMQEVATVCLKGCDDVAVLYTR